MISASRLRLHRCTPFPPNKAALCLLTLIAFLLWFRTPPETYRTDVEVGSPAELTRGLGGSMFSCVPRGPESV